jgi:predicted acyltransferase
VAQVQSASVATPEAKSQRLLALDVFRGATILGMILVNNPGDWGHLYKPLGHAPWHGWTPTDWVFPFFVFIVGTAQAYALRKYRTGSQLSPAVYWRIIRRTIVLIALGLFLNRSWSVFSYLLGDAPAIDLSNWRFPGVLQRIGLVYLASSLIVLHLGVRLQVALATLLLGGYWALLAWLPGSDYQQNLSAEGNVVRVVDQAVMEVSHLYTQGKSEKTDPEGLLSTLPSIVTALAGFWAGLFIQRRGATNPTVKTLLAVGVVCVVAGIAWGLVFPINKKLWTSSFVVLTAGWALTFLALALWLFDVRGWRRAGHLFGVVGVNAILAYVGSGLLAVLLSVTHVGELTTKDWLYATLCTSWASSPELASLCYALLNVAFWWFAMWLVSLKGWMLRV